MLLHDGELGPAQADQVASHAATCDRCRAWLTDMGAVGAVVRGDVVPTFTPAPAWQPGPVVSRLIPALAAVVAVALGLVVAQPPGDREQVAVGDRTSIERVVLPSVPRPPDATVTSGSDATTSSGGPSEDTGAESTPPTTPAAGGVAATEPASGPVVVGVLVPGGQTGPAEPVVRSVAVALAEGNAGGGVGGARLELLVGDANDPNAAPALGERGVKAVIGGYGATGQTWQAVGARGIPWFAPADVPPTPPATVVAVEVNHVTAGEMLAESLVGRGHHRVAAIVGKGGERRLAEGMHGTLQVDTLQIDTGAPCRPALDAAGVNGADVLALALEPVGVVRCLEALHPEFPIRQIVIPSTAVDDALVRLPEGFGLAATLGAPGPDDAGKGPTRFRSVTGIQRNYRAMVSYAAAELAVTALRNNPEDPFKGFASGGVYRSDLLTLNPSASPNNVAVQVVDLAAPKAAFQPPQGNQGYGP